MLTGAAAVTVRPQQPPAPNRAPAAPVQPAATPPAPVTVAPPPPELSTILVPIRASLAPLLPLIEANVPKTFADKLTERGFDVRYDIQRDPIALKMIGAGLHATTNAHYALEGCRGRLCLSCGFNERRPVAGIALHSHLTWNAQWRLRSSTKARPADFVKPCELTALRVDADRYIAPVVNAQLKEIARTIDANVPALTNLRPDAQRIWTSLQAPVEIAPRSWLLFEPVSVALGPISGNGLAVTSTLMLRARTRVVLGERPATAAKPLPNLSAFTPNAAGVRVPLDIEVPYEEAGRIITQQFGGRTYDVSGRKLRVDSIRLAPGPNGRLLLEATIDYRGGFLKNYSGAIFLEGTPGFDGATNSLIVPDLDYSLDPKRRGTFIRLADRLAHDSVRDELRKQARFPLTGELQAVRVEITRGLTRKLASNVDLRGRVDGISVQSVTASGAVIVVRLIAIGAAEVEIRN